MLPPTAAPQEVIKAIADIEAALDDVVNHGSDDELFIASYLQGHFAVEARQLEMAKEASIELLHTKVTKSLTNAFQNKELEEDDAEKVVALWNRMLNKVCV